MNQGGALRAAGSAPALASALGGPAGGRPCLSTADQPGPPGAHLVLHAAVFLGVLVSSSRSARQERSLRSRGMRSATPTPDPPSSRTGPAPMTTTGPSRPTDSEVPATAPPSGMHAGHTPAPPPLAKQPQAEGTRTDHSRERGRVAEAMPAMTKLDMVTLQKAYAEPT